MTQKGADKAALMGRNEYARHRGCAPNAVSKAINSGRIRAAVEFDGNGNFVGIDAVRADALWAGNTDPVEAARNGKFYDQQPGTAGAGITPAAAPESTAAPADAASTERPPVAGLQGNWICSRRHHRRRAARLATTTTTSKRGQSASNTRPRQPSSTT